METGVEIETVRGKVSSTPFRKVCPIAIRPLRKQLIIDVSNARQSLYIVRKIFQINDGVVQDLMKEDAGLGRKIKAADEVVQSLLKG